MFETRHNVVNILYSLKCMIESYRIQVQGGKLQRGEAALQQAEAVLEKAYHQADEALRIARRIGFVSRFCGDSVSSDCKVSVTEVWKEILKILRDEFSFSGIQTVNRVPQDFPPVRCESGALKEVLYHLAKNAIQAMPEGGSLVMGAQLTFSAKGEAATLITLTDTGLGIDEQIMIHLFEPFFTTKGEREGNGLGLYLARALVIKNQGRITVSSFRGFGTTFGLEFPIAKKNGVDEAA